MSHSTQIRGLLAVMALGLSMQLSEAVITLQIGGATRLGSLTRQRERYSCFWDCNLVACEIAHDDDECAYECQKTCRLRINDFDAVGRSGAPSDELSVKAEAVKAVAGSPLAAAELPAELEAGTSVRLLLPRNASAKNFAIWERCSPDASTGKFVEKAFHL